MLESLRIYPSNTYIELYQVMRRSISNYVPYNLCPSLNLNIFAVPYGRSYILP